MRALIVLALLVSVAYADDAFRAYRGQIVFSPDTPPSSSPELVKHLAANATKDHHYELIKGPPWDVNLVGVLSKDSTTSTLVFLDGDKPLQSIEVTPHHGIVIAHTSATTAAGFETSKTYTVRLIAGKAVLASAELTLRP